MFMFSMIKHCMNFSNPFSLNLFLPLPYSLTFSKPFEITAFDFDPRNVNNRQYQWCLFFLHSR